MQRMIVLEPEDIYNLLIHYDDGRHLPLDAQVTGFAINKYLSRMVGLAVESGHWPTEGADIGPGVPKIIQIRYEGKKVMTWDQKGADPLWMEAPEAPRG